MALYQKYRSLTFSDVVGQEHIVNSLLGSIRSNKLAHAFLLTGPRGIGKTTTARLLAKAANCLTINKLLSEGKETDGEPCNKCQSCLDINQGRALDVIEIDAASHTGVDEIREIIENARFAPTLSLKKVYIIDEVHMLSKSAFNALLKTLEEPPSHVIFIMATTEVHKIPATIISRAQRYDFKRATKDEIKENLKRVAAKEKIEIDEGAMELIALAAAGGHRDALSLLEQASAAGKPLDQKNIRGLLGITEDTQILELAGAIFNNNPEEGLKIAHVLYEGGYSMAELNKGICEVFRNTLLYIFAKDKYIENTKEYLAKISQFAKSSDPHKLIVTLRHFVEAGRLLKDVAEQILPIEMAIIEATKDGLITDKAPQTSQVQAKTEAAPIPISEKAAVSKQETPDSCPVPVIDMTKDIWQQIIDLTKVDNSTLAALLRDAKPGSMTKDNLALQVKFKFHKDRISEPKNMAILEKVVCQVMGNSYKIVCTLQDKTTPKKAEEPGINLESAVREVFEIA